QLAQLATAGEHPDGQRCLQRCRCRIDRASRVAPPPHTSCILAPNHHTTKRGTMAFEQITVEQRGRVALLTLNRPEKLNAWTPRMMAELTEAMRAAADDSATGAIGLTGAGRAFCAGADVDAVFRKQSEERDSGSESAPPPAAASAAAPPPQAPAQNWVSFLRNLPKPTIAAVNGAAVGIGVTQVLPMDFRIASENARFGMFFVKMGLVPELASSALLPQMVGQARALDWCLTGRMIPAA